MKKIILFLAIGAFAISCSSDSKDDAPAQSPIIGTWKPISEIHENTDNNQTTNELDPCDDKTRITYNSNNTVSAIVYYGTDINNCSSSNINNVSWLLDGNNLTLNYPGIGEMYSTITFSNKGTVMTDVSLDGPFKITTVYTKVE